MAQLTYREAVRDGIAQEMRRDEKVVFLGEDVAAAGGVFKTTVGLLEEFGPDRVRDTPISEQAIIGAAMGASMTGLRPVAEIMFSRFFRCLLGSRRKPDRQDTLYDRRAVLGSRWYCAAPTAAAAGSAPSIPRASKTGPWRSPD